MQCGPPDFESSGTDCTGRSFCESYTKPVSTKRVPSHAPVRELRKRTSATVRVAAHCTVIGLQRFDVVASGISHHAVVFWRRHAFSRRQVEIAVFVVVKPHRADGLASISDANFRCDVEFRAAPAIENEAPLIGESAFGESALTFPECSFATLQKMVDRTFLPFYN